MNPTRPAAAHAVVADANAPPPLQERKIAKGKLDVAAAANQQN